MSSNYNYSNLSNLEVPTSVDFTQDEELDDESVDAWFDSRRPTPAVGVQKLLRRRSCSKQAIPFCIPDSPQKENIPPHSSTPTVTPCNRNGGRRSGRLIASGSGASTPSGMENLYPPVTPGKVLNTTHTILPSVDEEEQQSPDRRVITDSDSGVDRPLGSHVKTPSKSPSSGMETPCAGKKYDLRRFTESGHPVRRSSVVSVSPVDYHEPAISSSTKPRLSARRSRRKTIQIVLQPETGAINEETGNSDGKLACDSSARSTVASINPDAVAVEASATSVPSSDYESNNIAPVRVRDSILSNLRHSIPSVSSAFENVPSPVILPILPSCQNKARVVAHANVVHEPTDDAQPNLASKELTRGQPASCTVEPEVRPKKSPANVPGVMEELRQMTVQHGNQGKSVRLIDKKTTLESIKNREVAVATNNDQPEVERLESSSSESSDACNAGLSSAKRNGGLNIGGIAAALHRMRTRAVAIVAPTSVRKPMPNVKAVVASHAVANREPCANSRARPLQSVLPAARHRSGSCERGAALGAVSPTKKAKKSEKQARTPVIKTWELPPNLPIARRRPSTIPKPFHLETEERGRVKQALFNEKVKKMEAEQAERRSFHAAGTPTVLRKRPWTPQKVDQPPIEFNPFSLHISERLELRHNFEKMVSQHLDQKSRDLAALKEKQEKDVREELRKKMEFKAQPVRYRKAYRETRTSAPYALRRNARK